MFKYELNFKIGTVFNKIRILIYFMFVQIIFTTLNTFIFNLFSQ